ncbi:MAG TPA: nuclear transport factor 2 family protein [Candidatus Baltobacteraceae bacterium]|nr:nuclear transport factor 2 family protein [Candidatus Baltobacteraceae bacterium]
MAPIDQVLAAMSSGDSKRLAGVYSSDAVIVDDQAPFQWTGSNAGEDWFATTAGRWGKLWYGKFVPTLRSPLQPAANMQFGPASAYVTVPGKLTSRLAGKRIDQRGVLTFTLRRVSGAWKITSQIWTSTS